MHNDSLWHPKFFSPRLVFTKALFGAHIDLGWGSKYSFYFLFSPLNWPPKIVLEWKIYSLVSTVKYWWPFFRLFEETSKHPSIPHQLPNNRNEISCWFAHESSSQNSIGEVFDRQLLVSQKRIGHENVGNIYLYKK